MIRKTLSIGAFSVLLVSCAGDAPAGDASAGDTPRVLAVSMEAVASPAGPKSGEPFVSASGDHIYMSWLEASAEGGHDLRFARFDGTDWTPAATIAHSESFFVNWADFPSLTPSPDGTLWAHWLQRGQDGGYDYGVRVARSSDEGATWSEPWTPHDDESPTEHGFVSALATDDGMGFVWLDGRTYAAGADGSEPRREMTLRYRVAGTAGLPGPETLLDGRVCDCCQTDAAMAASGPVVVYRNRSDAEIRDIYITRMVDGVWTEGAPVHGDGWEIAGCPVNGPAVVAEGREVAVAWFTAAGDVPHVKVAFSSDGGATFGAPTVVDGGNPAGRVDLVRTQTGSVLVSWLERTGGENAEVRLREVSGDGTTSESVTLTGSSAERASGFPRMVEAPDGTLLMAWTDVIGDAPQVRVTRIERER
ncbi:MAG: sialidase family protein [Gemmatimonadetes bacterium]|nr:sialidase family protein [Gemmatimonadota bacterium]MDA1103218.1 sialidase family protein [Gemmatimonadota bacterium]